MRLVVILFAIMMLLCGIRASVRVSPTSRYPEKNGFAPFSCVGTVSGHIYADNYFELYVNGRFITADPLPDVPVQAVRVEFTVDTTKPREYAVLLRDAMGSSNGLTYFNEVGGGSFRMALSDGTVTSDDWQCQVVNSGPDIENCCSTFNATTRFCTNDGTCSTTESEYDAKWYETGFDFSSWPRAVEYNEEDATNDDHVPQFEISNPLSAAPLSTACYETLPPPLSTNTGGVVQPSECLNRTDPSIAWDTSRYIWSSDLLEHNTLLCRYTAAPTVATPADPSMHCPPCVAENRTQQRVRRELRALSDDQWQRVVDAMWVLKTTPEDEGQERYGQHFHPYDYFVARHGVVADDVRGDQGHAAAGFITFHDAFLLEFENALLAVDPDIEGLPYWDASIANPSIFTERMMGSAPGTGRNNEVVDGAFADWPIEGDFNIGDYEQFMRHPENNGFFGSDLGFLRSASSQLDTTTMTRFGGPYVMPEHDFWACAMLKGSWLDWYQCIDLTTPGYVNVWLHGSAHVVVGGMRDNDPTLAGDLTDLSTSPNDPLFMFHHNNLVRNKMWYMRQNYRKRYNHYGFPVVNSVHIGTLESYYGLNLNDELCNTWGYTVSELDLPIDAPSDAYVTHADLLCHLDPYTAPYVFDDFLDDDQSNDDDDDDGTCASRQFSLSSSDAIRVASSAVLIFCGIWASAYMAL